MNIPIVIYRKQYLPISETFIYEQITHLKHYKPYVLCQNKMDDAQYFPYRHIYRLRDIKNIAWKVRRKGVRLIYARFGPGGVDMLPLKQASRLPLLTSFHGSDVSRQLKKNPRYRMALPRLFQLGDGFTVVCKHMKDRLVELGCPEEKIKIVKSGIDLTKFPYEPKIFPDDKEHIQILSIGRLTEKKGMSDLITAFSRVLQGYPKAKLSIIGEGEDRQRLEELIKQLQLEDKVVLKGQLDHGTIQKELQRSDMFALASCKAADGNEEGIPNVIMEAMAAGRIVVATDHAGIPELVEHGKTGYLVPEKQPDALAQGILNALKQAEAWQVILREARNKVKMEHDIEKQIGKLEEWMGRIIHESRQRAKQLYAKRM